MSAMTERWKRRDAAAIDKLRLPTKKKEILRKLISEQDLPAWAWAGRRVYERILEGESANDILWAMKYCRRCPPPWGYESVNSEWARMQRQLQPTDWYWPKNTVVEEDPELIHFVMTSGRNE